MLNKKQKNTFLSFEIHQETFAVSVKKVPEVLQKQYITKIPNTPDFIKGVINFRGNIIPAIEMRTKFNFPPRKKDEKYVIIVFDLSIDNKKMLVGAIADKVNDVSAFDDEDIKPVPDLGLKYNAEFIKGMVKTGENFTMILDVDKVFSKEEVNIINQSKDKKTKSKTEEKKQGKTEKKKTSKETGKQKKTSKETEKKEKTRQKTSGNKKTSSEKKKTDKQKKKGKTDDEGSNPETEIK